MVSSALTDESELSHIRRFIVTFHMPDQSFIDEPMIVAHTRGEAIVLFNDLYLRWPEVPAVHDLGATPTISELALAVRMELFEPDGGEPLAGYDLV